MAWPAKPLALTKCEALTCDKYTPFDRFIRYRFRSSGPSRQHAKPQCFSDRARLDQRLYFRSATPSRVRRSSREFVPREVFDNLMTKTNTFMSCFPCIRCVPWFLEVEARQRRQDDAPGDKQVSLVPTMLPQKSSKPGSSRDSKAMSLPQRPKRSGRLARKALS